MADTINEIVCNSFTRILDEIEKFQANSEVSWYRGCSSTKYKLEPTLYRHPHIKAVDEISDLERTLTTRFVQRSLPFISRNIGDEWDKLFFMQHYGVPTRLLDWSENPFVSVYFALAGSAKASQNAALWMCDPIKWNRGALDHRSFAGGVLDASDTEISFYSPSGPIKDTPKLPVMMYGSYNSPRIVAQRGGFAIFGHGTEPMEIVAKANTFVEGTLTKIIIPKDDLGEIRRSLFRKGFTESVVFPDLDGLSKEMRRHFGFTD